MWQMLFPGKLVRYLDVPQNFDPRSAAGSTGDELEELVGRARGARRTAATIPRRCAASIAALQREPRRLVRDLYALRQAAAVEGADVRAVPRCCAPTLVLPVEESTPMLAQYRGRRRGGGGPQAARPGPGGAHGLVLRAAADRPDQDARTRRLLHRGRRLRAGAPLDQARHPDGWRSAENLVEAFLIGCDRQPHPVHRPGREGRGAGRRAVKESGAEGVLFCAPSFCDPALLDQPMAVTRRRTRGHPVDGLQVLREHRAVPGDPRAGRHLRRLDQAVERGMSQTDAARRASKDASQLRQKEMIAAALRSPGGGAGDRREERLHVRARQPDRAAAQLRPAARAAGDQRAAVGHARQDRRVHRPRREARPLRGRLHLRQERHRHDEVGQHRPDRPAPAEARPAAALVHRLLHVPEVVRAAARGVPLPGGDAARAVSGRRQASPTSMRDYVVEQLQDEDHPDPREDHRPARTTRTG